MKIGMFGLWGMNVPGVSFGGFETGFSEIAPRLVEKGHEVTIFCRKHAYPADKRLQSYKGVRLFYVPSTGDKNFANITTTLRALGYSFLQDEFDIYFFVNIGMGFHCLLAKLFGKTVILNVDGLDWKRAKWGFIAKAYFRLAAEAAIACCDSLVTDAKAMQDFYLDAFYKESEFIAYGAYIENSTNPSLVKNYGVEPLEYYLIASRLIPENNADLIISAFEKLETDKKLLVAGGANYDSPFHQQLMQTQDKRILFTGHIDAAEVIKELHCNCYAYLHGHSVGGTNPALLKALGYGNCILALNTPFNAEVLQDEYGLLFEREIDDLLDKLHSIEFHPEAAQQLRSKAPNRIREAYTWDAVAAEYETLFQRFCNP